MDIKDYAVPIIMFDGLSGRIFMTNKLQLKKLAAAIASLEQEAKKVRELHLKDPFLKRLYTMKGLVV